MAGGSIKKNYILNVCYQMLSILVPLITTPYTSRVLGAEGVGRYSYAESVVSYFVLFAVLGTGTYAQREISYVQDDIEERSRVFFNTLIFRAITSTVMIIVYLGSFSGNIMSAILSLNIIAVAVDITWFFQGMEEFGKIVSRNVAFKLLNIIYIFIFIKEPDDLWRYAVGIGTLNLVCNITMWGYLRGYVTLVDKKNINPLKDIRVIWSLFIPTIAIQIYTIFDKTMLGLFTETSIENGYYEQSMKIVRMLQFIVTSLGTVMAPRIGYYYARSEGEKVTEYVMKSYQFVWFIGIPIAFGVIGISDNLVPWFLGEGYDKAKALLKLLPFLAVIIGISNVTGIQYLLPTKRQNILTKTVVTGACVNFCLNLLLIPILFSIGAAIASVISEIVITIVQLIYVRDELEIKDIIKSGWKYVVSGIVMIMVLRIENVCLASSFQNTAIMMITGVLVYSVMIIVMKDEFVMENYNAGIVLIRKVLGRRKGR